MMEQSRYYQGHTITVAVHWKPGITKKNKKKHRKSQRKKKEIQARGGERKYTRRENARSS
jgi:hypothetical protein